MSYTVIATDHGRQTAVVAASALDALSIMKSADRPNVTVFTKTGRSVSIAELEAMSIKKSKRRARRGW